MLAEMGTELMATPRVRLRVNGAERALGLAPGTTLLQAPRDGLGLTGANAGR
jgi:aerobic-type carbon monoxide dehydrogenase small subunit (CoxS/CutS family)